MDPVLKRVALEAVEAFVSMGNIVDRVPSCSHGKVKYTGAYLLKHIGTGKLYVGSHSNLYSRPYQHNHLLKNKTHWNKELQEAYDESPEFSKFIIVTETREEAYDIEQAILDKYHGTGVLFNIAKDSKIPMAGLEVSDETRSKLSEATKGRPKSDEHRMKISLAAMGHKHSPETIAKLVAAAKARGIRPELTLLAAEKCSVKVEADGVIYPSKKAAAKAFNLAESSVTKRILSKNPDFDSWKYA